MRDSRIQKTITPIDGSVLVERPLASERDIDTALATAVAAEHKWKRVAVAERVALVRRMIDWCVARADVLVSKLSHGEHRQLEIAMALATSPRMLLLDEPMAGMGPDESARMVNTLRELKRELTILLIEHDMEAVFALADRITVLVYGRIIASGGPEAIRVSSSSLSRATSGAARPWAARR